VSPVDKQQHLLIPRGPVNIDFPPPSIKQRQVATSLLKAQKALAAAQKTIKDLRAKLAARRKQCRGK
jgi:hypothetical protein